MHPPWLPPIKGTESRYHELFALLGGVSKSNTSKPAGTSSNQHSTQHSTSNLIQPAIYLFMRHNRILLVYGGTLRISLFCMSCVPLPRYPISWNPAVGGQTGNPGPTSLAPRPASWATKPGPTHHAQDTPHDPSRNLAPSGLSLHWVQQEHAARCCHGMETGFFPIV